MIRMRSDKFTGNVFVANLPRDFTDDQLAEIFDPYGIVIGALIARDPVTKQSKGCGLVNIAQVGALDRAIKGLNGTAVGGRKIEVRAADPDMSISIRSERPAPRPPSPAATVITSRPRRPVQVEYRSLGRRA
jgi:RNA recognition motif-containing protein